jgi:Spy/CpxP family protein refolding chaperone
MEGILTPEQKKARDEARKTAKAAGKNRKEIHEAVLAAINLTDAQKTKLDEARKAAEATRKEFRQKVMDILTPAQKDKLKARQQRRKAKESAKPAKPAETNQSY